MTNRALMGHVVDQLKQEGLITEDISVYQVRQDDTPWFIQGLLGGGGWIAAFFLLATIGFCISTVFVTLDQTTSSLLLMVIGAIFVIGTTTLVRSNKADGFFITQLLFMCHIAGQLAFIGGMVLGFELWRDDATLIMTLMIIILMQVIFIWLYPNVIYRFLGMIFIAMCLTGIEVILESPLIISLSVGSLFLVAILIWLDRLPEHWQIYQMRLLHPIGYGAIMGALGLLVYEVSNRYYAWETVPTTINITGILLVVCLLSVILTLLHEYEIALSSRFSIMVIVFAVVLSGIVIGTPGIVAGGIVILLAFRRRNMILQGIGYAFFAGFIVYYYYWLDVTLLTKSIILIVTGGLLLAGRFGLNRIVMVPDVKKGQSS